MPCGGVSHVGWVYRKPSNEDVMGIVEIELDSIDLTL